jgi:predicted RNase H-like HicB family nuclease
MHKYLIIIEKTETGFSSYSPDLLGCVSTGATRAEVEKNMQEAIEFHIEGMQEEGYPIPDPSSESTYLEVAS